MFWLDLFFILHLGLHLLFLKHSRNECRDAQSWAFIVGAAVRGLLDLPGGPASG